MNFHLSFQVLSVFMNMQIRSISFLTNEWKYAGDCLIWFQIEKFTDQVQWKACNLGEYKAFV